MRATTTESIREIGKIALELGEIERKMIKLKRRGHESGNGERKVKKRAVYFEIREPTTLDVEK